MKNKSPSLLFLKLDKLVGVTPIIGIRNSVKEQYPDIMKDISKYEVDVRNHIHIGEPPDPDRIRTYEPLTGLEHITSNVWHYDTDYVLGNKPLLN